MVDAVGQAVLFLAPMPANTPSVSQLKRAIEITERIEQLQRELSSILGSAAPVAAAASTAAAPAAKRGRRKGNLSPEARERIAAAQRLRWAKAKGLSTSAAPAASAKPARKARAKRAVSAEARAKMAEAARRRWAAARKK